MLRLHRLLQDLLIPHIQYSQLSYENVVRDKAKNVHTWLDVGCGHHLLVPWKEEEEKNLVDSIPMLIGIDADLDSVMRHRSLKNVVCGNIRELPFQANLFQLVTANMVVEHLDRPLEQFEEIHRVLSPGGRFVFHTPNAFGYPVLISRLMPERMKKRLALYIEGRGEVDVFPAYYRANTLGQVQMIANRVGFAIEEFRYVSSVPALSKFPGLFLIELLYLRLVEAFQSLSFLRQTMIVCLKKASVTHETES